jgi:Protein of unknown function (DUF2442).
VANEDYTVHIGFERGDKLVFNMHSQVKTIPYARPQNIDYFKTVRFDDKSIYWESEGEKRGIIPLRFSLDSILFSLRD